MRHRANGYKLGRNTAHRRAMWRNMAVSLFTHGQITTTLPKAKSLQPFVEKLITAARKGDLASRRRVLAALGDRIAIKHDEDADVKRNRYGELVGGPKVVKKLFEEIAPRYADRNGGYTRIIKLAKHRIGDGASLCVIQLVGEEEAGPQVRGQYSRRREKANRRMEFAAKLRKGQGKADMPEAQAPEGADAVVPTAEGSEAPVPSDAVPQTPEQQASQGETTSPETPNTPETPETPTT